MIDIFIIISPHVAEEETIINMKEPGDKDWTPFLPLGYLLQIACPRKDFATQTWGNVLEGLMK